MRTSITARRTVLVPALGLALVATMTACSSSSSSSSSTVAPTASATTSSPAAAATTSSPAASASASPTFTGTAATIAKNWVTFITGTTPTATKVSLLQDGSKYAAVLAASTSSASAKASGATIQSVTLTSSTEATVVYTITVSGVAMLSGQKGTAVLEDGVWKVGDSSFCSLASLESNGAAVPGCPAS